MRTSSREILIADSHVEDLSILLGGLAPSVEAWVVQPDEDALPKIAKALASPGLTKLHLLAHGAPGEIRLGSKPLTAADFRSRFDGAAQRDVDIAFWSCHTGAGEAGLDFVQAVAETTGARVAVSSGLVGAARLGGGWRLAGLEQAPFTEQAQADFKHVLDVTPSAFSIFRVADISDSGSSSTDGVTQLTTLTFSGKLNSASFPGGFPASVTVFVDINNDGVKDSGETSLFVSVVDVNGNFGGNLSFAADGIYHVTAVTTPPTLSDPVHSTIDVTIDTTIPGAPSGLGLHADNGHLNNDGITNNPAIDVTGVESGATLQYSYDSGATWHSAASGATSFNLPEGDYAGGSIFIKQTDLAGNDGTATVVNIPTFKIDTTADAAPTVLNLAAADDTFGVTGTNADNLTKNTAALTIDGTGVTGSRVELFDDVDNDGVVDGGESLGTVMVAGGAWSNDVVLAEGAHNVKAIQMDVAGNVSDASSVLKITVDTTANAPAALNLADVDDSFGPTGTSSDNITKNTAELTIDGTGETDATVELFDDADNDGVVDGGESLGTVLIAGGVWNADVTLVEGTHNVKAIQTDVAGNVSAASTALAITVDVTADAAPAALNLITADDTFGSTGTSADNITRNVSGLTIDGTGVNGSTVELFDDKDSDGAVDAGESLGTALVADGAWNTDVTLAEGTHNVKAIQTDVAGNASPASTALSISVDTTADAAPVALNLAATDDTFDVTGTNSDNITFLTNGLTIDGTGATGSTVELFDDKDNDGVVDGGESLGTVLVAGGVWSTDVTLAEGTHNVKAIQTDVAGNVSSTSTALSITVDTTVNAPGALDLAAEDDTFGSVGTNSDNITKNTAALTISGTGETGAWVEVFDDKNSDGVEDADEFLNGGVITGSSWTLDIALLEGAHNIKAIQEDVAANLSAASTALSITVDTTADAAPAALNLAAVDDTFGSTGTNADNITNNTTGLTIDGTGAVGSTVELFDDANSNGVVDSGESLGTTPVAGGVWSADVTLAQGAHNVKAIQTDGAGNVSLASAALSITVDATVNAPAALNLADADDSSGSAGTNSDNITKNTAALTIDGTGETDATVELFDDADNDGVVDGGESLGTVVVAGGVWSADVTLAEGTHNVKATQTDVAGNVSSASTALSITVDATADTAPAALNLADTDDSSGSSGSNTDNITKNASGLTIDGTGVSGSTVELFDDADNDGVVDGGESLGTALVVGGAWNADVSLTEGVHNVKAIQNDVAGNSSAASAALTITVDATAPVANNATVPGVEDSASVTVTLSGTDVGGIAFYKLTSLPANGTLYTDAGLSTLATAGTDYVAATFYFKPDANFNGDTTFGYTVIDVAGNADVTPATETIRLSAINDAPTKALDSVSLPAVDEDTANPTGRTVSQLFGSGFSDAKDDQVANAGSIAGTLQAVAITNNAATEVEGKWQWFDGLVWNAIEAVSTSNALVLDSATLVRFIPTANYNGVPGALTVRLIETGNAYESGDTLNVIGSKSGGTTVISDSNNTVKLTTLINSVEDTPAIIDGDDKGAVKEDTQLSDIGQLTVADPDAGQAAFQGVNEQPGDKGYGKFSIVANGTWLYNLNNVSAQSLAVGTTVQDSYDFFSIDGTKKTVTVDIQGTNDVPTVEGALSATSAEGDTSYDLDLLAGANDVDQGEDSTLVLTNVRYSVDGGVPTDTTPEGLVRSGSTLTVDPSHSTFEHLALGESIQIVVGYDVTDIHGAKVSQTETITITGTNDDPTLIVGAATAALVEAGGVANATAGVADSSITLTKGDVDGTAVYDTGYLVSHGWSTANGGLTFTTTGAYGTAILTVASGVVSYHLDDSKPATQALNAGQAVTESFPIKVTDGIATISTDVVFNITGSNDAPTVTAALTTTAAEGSASQDLDLVAGAADVDAGDKLTVSGVILSDGLTLSGNTLTLDPTHSTFNHLAAGDHTTLVVNYNINDGQGGTIAQSETITINGTNDAPTVGADLAVTVKEGDDSLDLNLLDGASDVDDGEAGTLKVSDISYSITVDGGTASKGSGLPEGLTLSSHTLTIDPSSPAFDHLGEGVPASIEINYNVTDAQGAKVEQTATVTITGANDAPTVDSALAATAAEGDDAFDLNLLDTAEDIDDGETATLAVSDITYTVTVGDADPTTGTSLPAGVAFDDDKILTVDPTSPVFDHLAEGVPVTIEVGYSIIDAQDATVEQSATVTITGTNDAPTVKADLAATAQEGDDSFSLNLLDGASDLDDGETATLSVSDLTFTVSVDDAEPSTGTELPAGVTLNNTALVIDPTSASGFDHLAEGVPETIEVSYNVIDDQGATVEQTATITVTGINDEPAVGSALAYTVEEGDPSFDVDLLSGATDADDGETETLSVSDITYTVIVDDGEPTTSTDLPAGVTIFENTLSIDPQDAAFDHLPAGVPTSIEVAYTITDAQGATVEQSATVTITSTNDAPTVGAALAATAQEGDETAIALNLLEGAADVDDGETETLEVSDITYTVTIGDGEPVTGSDLPPGVTLEDNTLTVDPNDPAFDPLTEGEPATIELSYNVIDAQGEVAAQTATVTVTGINDVPTVGSPLFVAEDEGNPSFDVDLLNGATDADAGETETLSAADLVFTVTTGGGEPSISTDLPAGVTIFENTLSVDPQDPAFDHLAAGEQTTIAVAYMIVDTQGAEVEQTATITITGAEILPTSLADVTVDLAESSDTGRSNIDNVTKDNTPTVTLDLTGKALVEGDIVQIVDSTDADKVVGSYSVTAEQATTGLGLLDITVDTLVDGAHGFKARLSDKFGNDIGEASDKALSVKVDTTLPTSLVAVSADLQASSDTGRSNTDNVTKDSTPTVAVDLTGKALSAGDYVQIIDASNGNAVVANFAVNTAAATAGLGLVELTTSKLADGRHNLKVQITDQAGNVGAASDENLSVKVDTVKPTSLATLTVDLQAGSDTGRSNTDNVTKDNTPTVSVDLTGKALSAGDYVQIIDASNGNAVVGNYAVNAATAAVGLGVIDITTNKLTDGVHNLKVQITDQAGNIGLASDKAEVVKVDTTLPTSLAAVKADLKADSDTGISNTDNLTKDNTPTVTVDLTGKVLSAGDYIQVIDASNGNAVVGNYAVNAATATAGLGLVDITTSKLIDGDHNLKVQITDQAGNIGVASSKAEVVTVDTTLPTSLAAVRVDLKSTSDTGISHTDNLTNDNTPTVTVNLTGRTLNAGDVVQIVDASNDNAVVGKLLVNKATAATGLTKLDITTSLLADGTHDLKAQITDQAGNVGKASTTALPVTVDTAASIATPTIDSVKDNVGAVQGDIVSGDRTDDTSLVLQGHLVGALGAGESLVVFDGKTALGNATVTGSNWTFSDSTLADGNSVSYTVAVSDAAGNVGVHSGAFKAIIDVTELYLTSSSDDDWIYATANNDVLDGSNDLFVTVSYENAKAGVTVNLELDGQPQHTGGSGVDTLIGIDNLDGSKFNDNLTGDAHDNYLSGGVGQDILSGKLGADTFYYWGVNDSKSSVPDIITDFSTAQGDNIDLGDVIAGTLNFIGNAAFSHKAGELNYAVISGNTWVSADTNGDGNADFTIELLGVHTLSASDFVL